MIPVSAHVSMKALKVFGPRARRDNPAPRVMRILESRRWEPYAFRIVLLDPLYEWDAPYMTGATGSMYGDVKLHPFIA